MTEILFFSDDDMGHLLPTFPIAKNLKEQGFKITYVGQEKVIKMADEMGFDTHNLFQTHPGSQKLSNILSGMLDDVFEERKPQLIIATAHSTLEILALYFRYRIKTVLVWSHFPMGLRFDSLRKNPYIERAQGFALERMKKIDPVELYEMIELFQKEGHEIKELKDLVELCNEFTHFITCTKEMYFTRVANRKNEIYLGYKHYLPRLNPDYASDGLMERVQQQKAKNKKVIFCSLGTMSGKLFPEKTKRFFEFMIECMSHSQLQNYFMVIAAGNLQAEFSDLDIPNNVTVEKWVPQSELLTETDLAIIHGGMGSVKECIFSDVPMLINAMGRDQFENAKMVDKHDLGKEMDFEKMSTTEVVKMITSLGDRIYKENLKMMKDHFVNDFNQKKEVTFAEQLIEQPQSLKILS